MRAIVSSFLSCLVVFEGWGFEAVGASEPSRATGALGDSRAGEALRAAEALLDRGASSEYRGESLGAIRFPVGGVGSGSIEIDGRGLRPAWWIRGDGTPSELPRSFFAIRIAEETKTPRVRVLQTVPEGPFPPMQGLVFRGEHPFARLSFEDSSLLVEAALEAFSPFIPGDLRSSSLPAAIWTVSVRNLTPASVDVSVLATLDNLAASTAGGGTNHVLRKKWGTVLHLAGENATDPPASVPGGDMTLAMIVPAVEGETALSGSAVWVDLPSLLGDFEDDGLVVGPTQAASEAGGPSLSGALAARLRIEAWETRSVVFVSTWYFPETGTVRDGARRPGRLYEANWSDALDVTREVVARLDYLRERTRLFRDSFHASNLPRWFLDRVSAETSVLSTPILTLTRSGEVECREAWGADDRMHRERGTSPWVYAQAHARLFPALSRRIDEASISSRGKDEAPREGAEAGPETLEAASGAVLAVLRDHRLSTDGTWLSGLWPHVRETLDAAISRSDPEEKGISDPGSEGAGSGGTASVSLYLSALRAAENLAQVARDGEAASRYRRILAAGLPAVEESLRADLLSGGDPAREALPLDAGRTLDPSWLEAFALSLGLEREPEREREWLLALVRRNLRADFRDLPVPPEGLLGEDPGLLAGGSQERPRVDSILESVVAARLFHAGLAREAMLVFHAATLRRDGRPRGAAARNPFGDPAFGLGLGSASSLAAWSVYLAAQGQVIDGPEGLLGFKPRWRPENHVSFFTAPEGWGLYRQSRLGGTSRHAIALSHGRMRVETLVFELGFDPGAAPLSVRVQSVFLFSAPVEARHEVSGRELRVSLELPVELVAGQSLEVSVLPGG